MIPGFPRNQTWLSYVRDRETPLSIGTRPHLALLFEQRARDLDRAENNRADFDLLFPKLHFPTR